MHRIFLLLLATATIACVAAATQPSFIKNIGVKLCVNCAHFIHDATNYPYDPPPDNKFGKCALFGTQDTVTGVIKHEYASVCRCIGGECGTEARLYEELPPSPSTKDGDTYIDTTII